MLTMGSFLVIPRGRKYNGKSPGIPYLDNTSSHSSKVDSSGIEGPDATTDESDSGTSET